MPSPIKMQPELRLLVEGNPDENDPWMLAFDRLIRWMEIEFAVPPLALCADELPAAKLAREMYAAHLASMRAINESARKQALRTIADIVEAKHPRSVMIPADLRDDRPETILP